MRGRARGGARASGTEGTVREQEGDERFAAPGSYAVSVRPRRHTGGRQRAAHKSSTRLTRQHSGQFMYPCPRKGVWRESRRRRVGVAGTHAGTHSRRARVAPRACAVLLLFEHAAKAPRFMPRHLPRFATRPRGGHAFGLQLGADGQAWRGLAGRRVADKDAPWRRRTNVCGGEERSPTSTCTCSTCSTPSKPCPPHAAAACASSSCAPTNHTHTDLPSAKPPCTAP